MSTYLLAFVISDFQNVTNEAQNFSVYAEPAKMNQTNLAMNYSETILRALENFTGIPFVINKMDQVDIPIFPSSAMENWGLVFYG